MRFAQAVALVAMPILVGSAQAGSASLNLIVSVVVSSGVCGTSVTGRAVSVSCGSYASLPLLPPVGGIAPTRQQAFAGATVGSSDDGSAATGESRLRQVGVLPGWVTGNSPMAVYSGGANLSSWRVVSNDNAQHVELTISW